MDMYLPLLTPGLFTGLFIHVALCCFIILTAKKHQNTTDKSTDHSKEVVTTLEKNGQHPRLFIPNVLARWPWLRRVNPHYTVVKNEADAWVTSFQAFTPKAQDAFNRFDNDLLACLAYPDASREHVRAGCDLMHTLFLFDEYFDRSISTTIHQLKNIILHALRNPHIPRPKGEWVGGEVVRQFWESAIRNATPISQKRFIQNMDEYLEANILESTDKKDRRILDIKSHIELRRRTGAVKTAFCIIELGLDIPDEVMSHPTVQEMYLAAIDMIDLSNDVFSYNMEQRRGDELHNIITCVMNEHNTDINGAMLWIEDFLAVRADSFLAAMAALPQWEEPLNSQVKEYCNGLGQWVRANNEWSFEGERYFGNKGPEIKRSKWMSLLPKLDGGEIGPVQIDSDLL